MSLSNEQLLLLDALAYYAELSNKILYDNSNWSDDYISIGEFVDDINENKSKYSTVFDNILGYTDEELGMDKIIELIDNDTTLKSLVMVNPDTYNDKTTSSVCLVDPDTFDVYVIYVGNYAEGTYSYDGNDINTWIENMEGAVEADTTEQQIALEFYEKSIAAARQYLQNQDADLNITVTGHSAGGNYAQYVTTVYQQYMGGEYQAVNDIDRCVSFDGQGFSSAFLDKYTEAIEQRANKITGYCPTVSLVGALMNDIPGIEQRYIDIGKPNAVGIGYHMPAEMLDENGKFKAEGVPGMEYILLKTYTTSSVAIAEKLPGVDADKAAEGFGEFLNILVNSDGRDKNNIKMAVKSIIHNKDAMALLGVLTTEVITTETVAFRNPHIVVVDEIINEISNSIAGIQDLVEKGDSVCDLLGSLDGLFKRTFTLQSYIADSLVVDLDNDGFKLTTVGDGVYFDNNNSGLVEKTQWVSADDGLFAIDLNSDGFINDGSELFGTYTRLPDGILARSGFEALSQYDENGDGIIDEQDEVYSKLIIWQDKNSNGILFR